jgi:phage terminase large subunit-like protein
MKDNIFMLMNKKLILRKEQKLPSQDNWRIWLVCAGRGFGKTLTGAAAVNELMNSGKYKNLAIIGATLFDVRNIMIEGVSGILNVNPNIKYHISKRQLLWGNGGEGRGFTGEHYNKLRGYQFDLIWIDEFAKIAKVEELWQQINFCLRLGSRSKIIITTTPRNVAILKEIMKLKDTIITKGSSYDNKIHLSENFFYNIKKYENTPLGEQEIHGRIITDHHLWEENDIQYVEKIFKFGENSLDSNKMRVDNNNNYLDPNYSNQDSGDYIYSNNVKEDFVSQEIIVQNPDPCIRIDKLIQNLQLTHLTRDLVEDSKNNIHDTIDKLSRYYTECYPKMKEYIIGVDPAFGGRSETGIILLGINHDHKYIVLEDFSGQYKPEFWLDLIRQLAFKFQAAISIEINHGGDIFRDLLKGFRIIEQRAFISKYSRSIPCYIMYHNGQVLHHKPLEKLENQMCNFQENSKDRIDALVWALHYARSQHGDRTEYFHFFK